ncbi:diguanylate cyclase [Noviherbaspirillum sp. CPCC 100848]|uniref:Diguanylate cyclase n=1 Tax=Noviherbaspirillum album TaxID=3080276 RepID=A0ABU6JIX1_9BURK|nr:diguanylate cyclase [Noviherbaspirillum sp. CPCC 100848]MEC4723205.1 diguanylate cyclase [Noviherbaspirillum sp. CPCC 100848]
METSGGVILSAPTGRALPPCDASEPSELQHRLLEYQAILDNASLGITFTRRRTFLHCNQRFSEMFGWDSNELVGQPANLTYPSPAAYDRWLRMAAPVLSSGRRLDTEVQMARRDGSLFWCRMLGRLIDPDDASKGAIFITEDITERKEAAEAQRQLLLEYQAMLDNASLGVTFTRKRRFLHCNRRFSEMFGWTCEELIDQPTHMLYPSPAAYEELTRLARPILTSGQRLDLEVRMKRRDGTLFWCRVLAKSIDSSDPGKGAIYLTEDITERRSAQEALKRAHDELELRVQERTAELARANALLQAEIQERQLAEERIRYLAHHDALTGLPNRRLLQDRLGQALEMARRHRHLVAVQFIDLDCFKPVNDRLGHHVGDLLLQAVATRLRGLLRAVDTVARVGGDEFVIILPEMHEEGAAEETAQKVLAALSQPYEIDGHQMQVTPSIGVSLYPRDAQSAERLLSAADCAMYYAKGRGKGNWQVFREDMGVPG